MEASVRILYSPAFTLVSEYTSGEISGSEISNSIAIVGEHVFQTMRASKVEESGEDALLLGVGIFEGSVQRQGKAAWSISN